MSETVESCDENSSIIDKSDKGTMVIDSELMRKATFAFCFLIITTQYFFFTMPLAFLVNELINEWDHNKVTTGSIVGAFSFSLAAGASLSSKAAQHLHPKQTLIITIIVLTLSTPIFLLEFQRTSFAFMVFLIRMAQGFVIGICEPQLLTVMTCLYPDRLGFVTGAFELAASTSSMIGPLIGGIVYQTFGFSISLITPSVINCITSMAGLSLISQIQCLNPKKSSSSVNDVERNTVGNGQTIFILTVVLLGMVTETLTAMIVNTIESFYPNFCSNKFGKHESFVGAVLAFSGLVYCIGTVTAGYLVDKKTSRKPIICSGVIIMIVGSLGIDPYLLQTNSISSAAMLCILNFGSGITQITILPTLIVQYQHKADTTREDSACKMSSLYRAAYFTGAFMGPLAGGGLLQFLTYQDAYSVLACTLIANFAMLVILDMVYPNTIDLPMQRQSSYDNLECKE